MLVSGFFFYSCNSEEVIDDGERVESQVPDETRDEELKGLSLNLGEKWTVNPETAVGMENIGEILETFEGTDFKSLGTEVKKELGWIIDNCTMKGEDHNQFHIVLHAMLKEAKNLKKGKSQSTEKLTHYLKVYQVHFEE
jgi:hypothetical protein